MKAQAEVEGDRYNWWFVCSECHGYLKYGDRVCEGCRREISWAGTRLPGKRPYLGEETEPAE